MKKALITSGVLVAAALIVPAAAQADNAGGDDFATVAPGESVNVHVLYNDFSEDAHPLVGWTLTMLDGDGTRTDDRRLEFPAGWFKANEDGTITFTAKKDASGTASVDYGTWTARGNVVHAKLTVTIAQPSSSATPTTSAPATPAPTSSAPTTSAPTTSSSSTASSSTASSTAATAPTSTQPTSTATSSSRNASSTAGATSTITGTTTTGKTTGTPAPAPATGTQATGPVVQTDKTSGNSLPLGLGLGALALTGAGTATVAARRNR